MQLAGWITGIDSVLQGISSRDVLSLMCSMVLKICHILHFGMGTTVTLVIGMHVLCGHEAGSYQTLITWSLCTAVRILQWATVLCSSRVSSSIGGFLSQWGWLLLIKSLLWLWTNFVPSYSTAASHVNNPTWPKRPAIVVDDTYAYAQDYFASHQQCT